MVTNTKRYPKKRKYGKKRCCQICCCELYEDEPGTACQDCRAVVQQIRESLGGCCVPDNPGLAEWHAFRVEWHAERIAKEMGGMK